MGIQFEQITYASDFSLTQIVDDAALLRRQPIPSQAQGQDLEVWLNAVQIQCRPLIQSTGRRADLEAWLEMAELASPSP
jgi:hypothetical protein